MLLRVGIAVAAIAFGVTAAVAQDPIAARKELMKRSGQQLAAVNRMARGQDAFDAAKVNAAFDAFADKATQLPTLFPPNSQSGDTRALSKIWEDAAGWNAAIAKFGKDVADNRTKALANLDGLKAALPAVAENCGTCHQAFRRPGQ